MFWVDSVVAELRKRQLPLEWIDDAKTPSGRIHVGSLRGVVVHDLVYKALKSSGVKAKYTYIFDNHDPMDALPNYLPKEKFERYLGLPLFKVPSPEKGHNNYAEYYAFEFKNVFNEIGCNPEILWTADLYKSGKMNPLIKECLDKASEIRKIYAELYKKEIPKDWYPFQPYCPNCGKVSTTKVYDWDGQEVSFACEIDAVSWTMGCGFKGEISPFSVEGEIVGKLPWKVEWAARWKALGVTVEGAGEDHMSRGGSHDLASLICKRVINYSVPYALPYAFFLIGGRKMSSSKGRGSSASEMLEILPPELLRFLMVKTKISQQINFDPSGDIIPKLFDEYQKAADAYFDKGDKDLARIFELSQIDEVKKPPSIRFSVLAQWVQMPNMDGSIKKEGLGGWAKYAKVWVERYAPESEKFLIQQSLPESVKNLSDKQKEYLRKVSLELNKSWEPEDFQINLFEWAKELKLSSKDAFSAIYMPLLNKTYGPKAGWIILSLNREFVKNRFAEASDQRILANKNETENLKTLGRKDIFSVNKNLAKLYPSISVGIAIIKGVRIDKVSKNLEKEKAELLESLEGLTTEQLGQYPEVLSYRRLYKETGIDWHSRRPSPEALLRRVALKKGLYAINTCVDAYNLIVMKHRVSVGAFDLDKIEFPTVLRLAKREESILLLGDKEETQYSEKEIAYFDQKGGYNMDFNYRDAQRTAVQRATKNLYINVDGAYDITSRKVEHVLKEACDTIIKYCGGKLELFGVETAS